ncbi:MAG TPA: amino acid adenylation domain-containing protein, partial [Longimicrobium sp.]|nr:amino acid adenylation domain-containing protein [Longimicrobium sp.]
RWDHFFELGGHSLLAVRLVERMRQRGLHAEVGALFTTPTLAELAAAVGAESLGVRVPPNGIPTPCDAITPEMLPLVELDQAEIDRIAAGVPGGAANVQDVYPLAPLQEGVLFHHLMAEVGDPYLSSGLFAFGGREHLDAYLAALQAVIARHDILRTAVLWERLREPVQVVWREARLVVEEVELDSAAGEVAAQLWARFDPRHHRLDVRRAPLLRACIARDAARDRWVLLLQRHHLVNDHTTLEVLQAEIEAHLSGSVDGLPVPLPFRNYVAQARLGVSREEHERFFGEMLGDVREPTAPFGLLDVRGDGSRIAQARLAVEGGLAGRIRAEARRLGVSAASLCHVAWAQVLARASGCEDVVFGTLLFGRMQGGEGADRVLGPFLNTLPVRFWVDGVGVEEGVRRAHRLLAELLRHEHASLVLAQRCSGVQAPAPLFTALLNYRHSGAGGRARSGEIREAGARQIHSEERTNYPLTLSIDDLGEGFRLTAQVEASVDPERVCAMVHTALAGLVDALETAPQTPLARLDVLPAAERARVVEEWSGGEAEEAAETVHRLFEAQARRTPAAVALAWEGGELSYAELDRRANRLARHLRRRGVGPDVKVGLCLERSPELVVAILAVLKAGGAYVPIDPDYPEERLAFIVREIAAPLLLIHERVRERLPADVAVLGLDAAAAESEREPEQAPEVEVTPEHLAYVIYTSGSTGTPKGTEVPHRAIPGFFRGADYVRFDEGAVVLQHSSTSWDALTLELWPALLTGGRCVLYPERSAELEGLARMVERHGVNTLWLSSAFFNLIVDTRPGLLAGVRQVMTGGESVSPPHVRRALEMYPELRVVNGYGPSECTVFTNCYVVPPAFDAPVVPIGTPVGDRRVYLLDRWMSPVPIGVAGELCVGGPAVARGYLGRPGLTAERFVPSPFGPAGARLYRSGDRVRWRADGVLEFVERVDRQVKVRGFRIELGEIEARLLTHRGVREAVVLARRDGAGDPRLVAYYVGMGSEPVDAGALRSHLAAILPEYMVPAAYVRLQALPLTANRKVDRRALPAPDMAAGAAQAYEAPMTDVEVALAEIWSELLGVERVGRSDHFFELGGHSLRAVQLLSRVREALAVEVALGDVFARPVLADFARGLAAAAHAELPPIAPVERGGDLPLSFAQQRLWFLEEMGGLGGAYHVPRRLRLTGTLDRGALRRALDRIVARHEALRTTFADTGAAPVQRVAPVEESAFLLLEHDLRGHAEPGAELGRLLAEEARTPFDLAAGPLVRGRLALVGDEEHVLLLTMHHIVSDGWSMGVFVRELRALYGAFRAGEPDPLPPLPVQYADYAAWQRRWIGGAVLETQAAYWRETLAGVPELLELPTDRPRPARVDYNGARVRVTLDEELTAELKALGRRQGTTLFMTLLAGWATVLSRLSGQDDVVIGTPTANRGRTEIEGLIGFFVNTLAVRVDFSDSPAVAELLGRVKARALGAQQHQDLPFEQVVELLQPARSLAHHPLFQVLFAWQNASASGMELPGLIVGGVGAPSRETAKFDLSLDLQEAGGRIAGSLTYATSLFERATAERYAGYLERVLEQMVADDARAVERLALLPEAERRQVVEEWNATDAAYPIGLCLHELFEAQVARTPDAAAVSFAGQALTYAELNARANRLAHHLRALGVGPDVRVALCVERSAERVVGLLAVLQAGGAY